MDKKRTSTLVSPIDNVKKQYQVPEIILLGVLARSFGDCTNGSAESAGDCRGGAVAFVTCNNGGVAAIPDNCGGGATATPYFAPITPP